MHLMSRRVLSFFSLTLSILFFLLLESLYLYSQSTQNSIRVEKKFLFVKAIGLPDLVLSEEPYLRHRTLSDIFEVYPVDAALREYTKESFTLSKFHTEVK